jgi:hypothetical protein
MARIFPGLVGETVGPADYTAFMATDKYIREHPDVVGLDQRHLQGSEMDAGCCHADVVKAIEQFFPELIEALAYATDRYRRLKIWKDTPTSRGPIGKFRIFWCRATCSRRASASNSRT